MEEPISNNLKRAIKMGKRSHQKKLASADASASASGSADDALDHMLAEIVDEDEGMDLD